MSRPNTTVHKFENCERCGGRDPTSGKYTIEVDFTDLTAYVNDTTGFYGLGALRLQKTLRLCYPCYEEGFLTDIVKSRPSEYESFFELVKGV